MAHGILQPKRMSLEEDTSWPWNQSILLVFAEWALFKPATLGYQISLWESMHSKASSSAFSHFIFIKMALPAFVQLYYNTLKLTSLNTHTGKEIGSLRRTPVTGTTHSQQPTVFISIIMNSCSSTSWCFQILCMEKSRDTIIYIRSEQRSASSKPLMMPSTMGAFTHSVSLWQGIYWRNWRNLTHILPYFTEHMEPY